MPQLSDGSARSVGAAAAVALFVARARLTRHDFELTDAEAPVIADIVRKLDGIPLAIELCAARVGILGPSQISSRLARRFDLLVANARDAPARHGTLRDAIRLVLGTALARDREALAQCSIFRGGFSLPRLPRSVLELGAPSAPSVLDTLQSLYENPSSWPMSPTAVGASVATDCSESIREFAEEKLREQGGLARAVGATRALLPRNAGHAPRELASAARPP